MWVMRQAGRYLPEYRELRSQVDFVTLTRSAELAAEVTLQPRAALCAGCRHPVQRHHDAAAGHGHCARLSSPAQWWPRRSAADAQVQALPTLMPERDVPFVLDAVKLVRANAPRGVPLIGFAGAPFTLLCYLVSGRPSKEFGIARSFSVPAARGSERC